MGLLQLDAGPRDGSSTGRKSAESVPRQQTTRRLQTLRHFTCRKGDLHNETLSSAFFFFFPTAKLNHLFPIWLLEGSSEIPSHQEGQYLLTEKGRVHNLFSLW